MSSIQLLKQVFRKEKENIFLQKRRKVEEKTDQKKYTLVKYLKCFKKMLIKALIFQKQYSLEAHNQLFTLAK